MIKRAALGIVAGMVGASIFSSVTNAEGVELSSLILHCLAIACTFASSLYISRLQDTENSQQASKILRFISLDSLTGVLNRAFFMDRVRARNGCGVLLIIDADKFKKINDNFGHYSGDIALVRIAKAITNVTPEPGFVGRLGGEEFGVFIPDATLDFGVAIAEDVRKAVQAVDFSVAGSSIPLSVSIGVSVHSAADPIRMAFQQADDNLYAAKRGGRNRVSAAPNPVYLH